MSSFIGKLKEFVGIPAAEDYEYIDEYSDVQDDVYSDIYDSLPEEPLAEKDPYHSQAEPSGKEGTGLGSGGLNNVVGMPGASRFWGSVAEVLVMEPHAFEEMPQVIQSLRERKSVVLNLSQMEPAQAQRAVDFVAGATFTIDGHQERVGENIFLFTPSCVQVRTQSGVIHEAPQVVSPPSRISTTSWQTDPVLSHRAQ
ncbi:MAG: cell division protein SepF [Thermosynechococcaceae cyanobacterium MS004]|nr:cell division protein SepF [Thermosynechococcaceae cyanobacterium MS004]